MRATSWSCLSFVVMFALSTDLVQPCAAQNIAKGRPVIYSTSLANPDPNWVATNVVDGYIDGNWGHIWLLPGATGWVTVDMQQPMRITRVRVQNQHNAANRDRASKDFRVFVTSFSTNDITAYGAATWSSSFPDPISAPDPLPFIDFTTGGITGRYVTVAIDTIWRGSGGLGEIEVGTGTVAHAYWYPQNVDLMRRVRPDGVFNVDAQWSGLNNGGGVTYAAYYAIDAGHWSSQIGYSSQSVSNTATLRLTLPEAVHIQTLKHTYGGHRAVQYRVLASTNGFGSLTEIVPWTAVASDTPPANTIDTVVQYIQFEFLGTAVSEYLLVKEVQAYPGPMDQIPVTAGYNILPDPTVAEPVTQYGAGQWYDSPSQAVDGNIETYLRPNGVTNVHWFVIDLKDQYFLNGAGAGFYHGQGWNGMKIEVTPDVTVSGSTAWTVVYTNAAFHQGNTISFNGKFAARHVRVSSLDTTGTGALCEFELYAVPPPPGTLMTLR